MGPEFTHQLFLATLGASFVQLLESIEILARLIDEEVWTGTSHCIPYLNTMPTRSAFQVLIRSLVREIPAAHPPTGKVEVACWTWLRITRKYI